MKQSIAKPNEITTLIGDGCLFEGDITSSSSTRIDGKVSGNIKGNGSIIVGERGEVSGEVKAIEVIVFGRIDGNVQSERLEIKKNAIVRGDIFTKSLLIEDGGLYEGRCAMEGLSEQIGIESEFKVETNSSPAEFQSRA